MSTSDDTKPPYPGWPGRPIVERDEKGRFKRGSSGNVFGRPVKAVTARSVRQYHREILSETERLISIGGEAISAVQLAVRQMQAAGARGNYKAAEKVIAMHLASLRYVEARNHEEIQHLEALERRMKARKRSALNNDLLRDLNELREVAGKI